VLSRETLREHSAQRLPKLTGLLGSVRGLFRRCETDARFEITRKEQQLCGEDGGRDRDRTCDPYHVKEAITPQAFEIKQ
jgi:hypothetical protein